MINKKIKIQMCQVTFSAWSSFAKVSPRFRRAKLASHASLGDCEKRKRKILPEVLPCILGESSKTKASFYN